MQLYKIQILWYGVHHSSSIYRCCNYDIWTNTILINFKNVIPKQIKRLFYPRNDETKSLAGRSSLLQLKVQELRGVVVGCMCGVCVCVCVCVGGGGGNNVC